MVRVSAEHTLRVMTQPDGFFYFYFGTHCFSTVELIFKDQKKKEIKEKNGTASGFFYATSLASRLYEGTLNKTCQATAAAVRFDTMLRLSY